MGADIGLEAISNLLNCAVDFCLRQRPVLRPEHEPVGQTLLVRRQRRAAIQVEEADATKQNATVPLDRGLNLGGGGTRRRSRPGPARLRGSAGAARRAPAPAQPHPTLRGRLRRRSPAERADPTPPLRRDAARQAAGHGLGAGFLPDQERSAGVEGETACVGHVRGLCKAQAPAQQLQDALRVVQIIGASSAVPGGRLGGPGQQDGEDGSTRAAVPPRGA